MPSTISTSKKGGKDSDTASVDSEEARATGASKAQDWLRSFLNKKSDANPTPPSSNIPKASMESKSAGSDSDGEKKSGKSSVVSHHRLKRADDVVAPNSPQQKIAPTVVKPIPRPAPRRHASELSDITSDGGVKIKNANVRAAATGQWTGNLESDPDTDEEDAFGGPSAAASVNKGRGGSAAVKGGTATATAAAKGADSVEDSKRPSTSRRHHRRHSVSSRGEGEEEKGKEGERASRHHKSHHSSSRHRHRSLPERAVSDTEALSDIAEEEEEENEREGGGGPDDYDVLEAVARSAQQQQQQSVAAATSSLSIPTYTITDPSYFEELVQREVEKRLGALGVDVEEGYVSDATTKSRKSRWDAASVSRAQSPKLSAARKATKKLGRLQRPIKGLTEFK